MSDPLPPEVSHANHSANPQDGHFNPESPAAEEVNDVQSSEQSPIDAPEAVNPPSSNGQSQSVDSTAKSSNGSKPARSPGRELIDKLMKADKELTRVPLAGARSLPILTGLNPRGEFVEPQENVLVKLADLLIQTGRLYRFEDSVVMEISNLRGQRSLLTLRTGTEVSPKAQHALADLLICEIPLGKDTTQFPLPQSVTRMVLNHPHLLHQLPEITTYSANPIFDEYFQWCDDGWYESSGVMVHGRKMPIIPYTQTAAAHTESQNNTNSALPADTESCHLTKEQLLARLPRHLRTVLADFCFEDASDLANAVAALLTLLLRNHFVQEGKAMLFLVGNQPGVGKTLLARVFSVIADHEEPMLIAFHEQEQEIVKQIASHVHQGSRGVLLLDNARSRKGSLDMPVLEGLITSPAINPRLLGRNELVQRPNDVLWTISSNGIAMTPDLLSRSFSIRLKYEGKPEDRKFTLANPILYARQHRQTILGELAGMVYRWLSTPGINPGSHNHHPHRFSRWAELIGDILKSCGVQGFLANQSMITQDFNSSADELVRLAEEVLIDPTGPWFDSKRSAESAMRSAAEWRTYFTRAELNGESLMGKSSTAATVSIGRRLSQWVDRQVNVLLPLEKPTESDRAEGDRQWFSVSLKRQSLRGRKQVYGLQVTPDLPALKTARNTSGGWTDSTSCW